MIDIRLPAEIDLIDRWMDECGLARSRSYGRTRRIRTTGAGVVDRCEVDPCRTEFDFLWREGNRLKVKVRSVQTKGNEVARRYCSREVIAIDADRGRGRIDRDQEGWAVYLYWSN